MIRHSMAPPTAPPIITDSKMPRIIPKIIPATITSLTRGRGVIGSPVHLFRIRTTEKPPR